jgi:CubicO group peptidase (beta-lactamase class C family)
MLKPESLAKSLVPLPLQPEGVAWPTAEWPRGQAPAGLAACAEPLFSPNPASVTYALLVVWRGQLVFERYGAGAANYYRQYSWSMAKSVTHALVGIALAEGLLDLYAPAPVPEWQGHDDPRGAITLDQLLRMSSGLSFREDYVDPSQSDVLPMLAGPGRHDTGAFAASQPLVHAPGEAWSYSSGTTNVVCRLLREVVGGPSELLTFARERLFEPVGMRTALPDFDTSGTFIGSSFLHAVPEDFARFGLLYLRDGVWDGKRLLPEGWADYARTPTYATDEEAYGAHWWLAPGSSRFYANGFDGQRLLLSPEQDSLVLRCGRTPDASGQGVWDALFAVADALS